MNSVPPPLPSRPVSRSTTHARSVGPGLSAFTSKPTKKKIKLGDPIASYEAMIKAEVSKRNTRNIPTKMADVENLKQTLKLIALTNAFIAPLGRDCDGENVRNTTFRIVYGLCSPKGTHRIENGMMTQDLLKAFLKPQDSQIDSNSPPERRISRLIAELLLRPLSEDVSPNSEASHDYYNFNTSTLYGKDESENPTDSSTRHAHVLAKLVELGVTQDQIEALQAAIDQCPKNDVGSTPKAFEVLLYLASIGSGEIAEFVNISGEKGLYKPVASRTPSTPIGKPLSERVWNTFVYCAALTGYTFFALFAVYLSRKNPEN